MTRMWTAEPEWEQPAVNERPTSDCFSPLKLFCPQGPCILGVAAPMSNSSMNSTWLINTNLIRWPLDYTISILSQTYFSFFKTRKS
jgi:hypothetical protein